jgi:hypothetical protein
MFPKLEMFFFNCLLPELVDPRHFRSMPIRNPTYILEAKMKKKIGYTIPYEYNISYYLLYKLCHMILILPK